MLDKKAKQLIEISGKEYDLEIIEYGMVIMEDTIYTTLIVIVLGFVFHYMYESIIFLFMSMVGTSTMGGVSL